MRFLLTGNPNVGKSTFFNVMTKSNVKVANYTGITVERNTKSIKGNGRLFLVDLPGTYSVLPNSEDEGVVTHALCHDHYNGIVNIVDSTHLKRNLHFSIQLLELGVPTIIIANMIDELKRSGFKLDEKKLGELLNVEVVSMTALKTTDKDLDSISSILNRMPPKKALEINYGDVIENAIESIKSLLRYETLHVKKRWLAIQILEGNDKILDYINLVKKKEIMSIVSETEKTLINNNTALSLKGAIYYIRKEFISNVLDQCLVQVDEKNHLKNTNKLLDKYLTHPIFGTMIFFLVMILIYHISFGSGLLGLGNYLTGIFEVIYDKFLELSRIGLDAIGFKESEFLNQLLVDGALTGVGGVLVFLPQIVVLFILLSLVEGTGYMSRVAISMDGMLAKFGMNGKSIVPIVTGFGCTVPAIMATRTISNRKERILTILTLPFISCAARLPVYGFFVSIFFEKHQALVIFFIYILGVVIALLSGKIFSLSIFSDVKTNFAIELPPYRLPHWKNIISQALDKAKGFIKKAGTYILVGSIAIWFLMAVGPDGVTDIPDQSYLAYISQFFSPIFIPLGFGTWQATSAVFTGVLAKEAVVSSLAVIYGAKDVISATFNSVTALTFIVFISLYTPCIATIGTIRAETNSRKWTIFSIMYPLVVAYLVALLVKSFILLF
ncbi:ferrous iron transport protein B [Mycoplasmatota bacterium zrk1]